MLKFKLVALLVSLTFLSPSLANITGNDTHIFNPSFDDSGLVTVDSSETVKPGTLLSSIYISRAENSLPDTWDSMGAKIDSNDSMVFSDLSFSYGIMERLDVSLSFAYLWSQQTDRAETGAQFGALGLNDLRFASKYTLSQNGKFGSALRFGANLNEAKRSPFAGIDSGPTFNFEWIGDYKIRENSRLAMNFGYRHRNNGNVVERSVYKPQANSLMSSLGFTHYFSPSQIGISAEIYAAKPVESVANEFTQHDESILSEGLIGLYYRSNSKWRAHVGYAHEISKGLFTAENRFYMGFVLPLELNRAEAEVVPAEPVIIYKETPPQVVQNIYQGFKPAEIEQMQSVPFNRLTLEHEFQLQTQLPPADLKSKPPFEVLRLENFDFDFGSSEIRTSYAPMLQRLAEYLAAPPQVLKVRIEGHTDSLGSEERNKKRSQGRAEAVRDYLKRLPLTAQLPIEAIGFGSDRPIGDNTLPEGRTKNRRVEVRILRRIPELQKSGESIILK